MLVASGDWRTATNKPSDAEGRHPSIPLAQVYERINPHGRRYLVGRIGTAKLLIVATGEISRGEPVWQAFLGEGPYGPDDWARGVALYERATGRQAPGFGVLTVPPEAHMAADLIEINRQQG